MNVWEFLTTNLILDLSIISWAIAQVLKGLIILIRERRLNIARMLEGGGMPSSHAAFVCTCATAVGRMYGWGSPLFAIAAVVAIVVMYDAFNVRQAAGEQGTPFPRWRPARCWASWWAGWAVSGSPSPDGGR